MRGLAEQWWWSPADNNAELEKFHRSEPKQKMKVLHWKQPLLSTLHLVLVCLQMLLLCMLLEWAASRHPL